MRTLAIVLGGLHVAAAATSPGILTLSADNNCANVSFSVRAFATNIIVDRPSNAELSTNAQVNAYFQSIPAALNDSTPAKRGGNVVLAGTYCLPQNTAAGYRTATDRFPNPPLQILVHGATHTKEYWDQGAWAETNDTYSWRKAANEAGYATLAVDKLGNGQSSHPDPFWDVQLPLQMETIHSMILQIKAGHSQIAKPRSVIFVGHSSGSILGAALAESHPDDVDALVLTAYAPGYYSSKDATVAQEYQAAAVSDPQRFGNLSYGYFMQNNVTAYTDIGYLQGHYDPAIALKDFATRGIQPIGEGFNASGPETQPSYKGKVLVVTGANDSIVCGDVPAANCTSVPDKVMEVNATFSSCTGFEYYVPQNTGHNINWHYNALRTFDVILNKLDYLLKRTSAGLQVDPPGPIQQGRQQ